jgi:hypothetical protein
MISGYPSGVQLCSPGSGECLIPGSLCAPSADVPGTLFLLCISPADSGSDGASNDGGLIADTRGE